MLRHQIKHISDKLQNELLSNKKKGKFFPNYCFLIFKALSLFYLYFNKHGMCIFSVLNMHNVYLENFIS